MIFTETCSCGATFKIDHNLASRVDSMVESWRITHRHPEPPTLEATLEDFDLASAIRDEVAEQLRARDPRDTSYSITVDAPEAPEGWDSRPVPTVPTPREGREVPSSPHAPGPQLSDLMCNRRASAPQGRPHLSCMREANHPGNHRFTDASGVVQVSGECTCPLVLSRDGHLQPTFHSNSCPFAANPGASDRADGVDLS